MAKRTTPSTRFWSKVQIINDADSCWLWTGKISQTGGYGRFYLSNPEREVPAHKFAYEDTNGPLPEGMKALHRCDVRPCVRPSHVFPGTQKDNIQDAMKKGRFPQHQYFRGKHFHTPKKLSADAVREIRDKYANERISQQKLADQYGVSQVMISTIVRGATWTHIV